MSSENKPDVLDEIAAKATAATKALNELREAAGSAPVTIVVNCGGLLASNDALEDALVAALNRAAKRGVMPRFTRGAK